MNLYYSRMAPNPDRVRYFLQEKGLWEDFPKTEINIMKLEHREPAYRAISPMGHVPVLLLDDGTGLTESRAICGYLEALHPEPNLMGADPLERAKIEMWDRRVELTYFMQIAGWFRNSHPAMAELEKPQNPEWAATSSERAKKVAKFFDRRLGESPYVAGDPLHHRRHHAPRLDGLRQAGQVQAVGRARQPQRMARTGFGPARSGALVALSLDIKFCHSCPRAVAAAAKASVMFESKSRVKIAARSSTMGITYLNSCSCLNRAGLMNAALTNISLSDRPRMSPEFSISRRSSALRALSS